MNAAEIQHLYSRAGFGLPLEEFNSKSKSRKKIVSKLFKSSEINTDLKIDFSDLSSFFEENTLIFKTEKDKTRVMKRTKLLREKTLEINFSWLDRMTTSDAVLREKMTLFWANVFVCKDNNAVLALKYNNVLRNHALGDFGEFVKSIAKEPSMSKYLNNRQNVKESPNENFARELMELFTLGAGNYTEQDIKESARAFTGWSFKKDGSFILRKRRHDYGEKSFFRKKGNFGGDDIIDIILEQKQCARFICEKVYKYFVNPTINKEHIDELVNVFYGDYNIKKLMNHLFMSDWFYDKNNIGVKIKSPIELLVGIKKIVPYSFEKPRQQLYFQTLMGQTPLDPPNVAGWKGDKNWIDSNTLMVRLKLASVLLNNSVINLDEKGDFEATFEKYYNREQNRKRFIKINRDWSSFDRAFAKKDYREIKSVLLTAELDKDTEEFIDNLKMENKRDYCVQLMSIPEYQLC